ncbi:two-domain cob(I)yrinic acid a,c-diamide adenosyltransferase PduO [Entomohabitans teleogrylli]|uniref:two-domain cob(I)yrinic acid a,c-diamide adenosyltransferase PduO n=1 Tax=Entomohabitans teleogrylli TaxID=1384589 RepID=UPI00073D524C|nr:two-domain cob(I)yrinic acid a,c-diamide adenosyltransferase PduO [Entomohabitans teleogrylli]
MAIYTRTGDKGTTSLFTGQRVSKTHPRVEAYGTLDELNATLSLSAKAVGLAENRQLLEALQHQIFYFSAELASESTAPDPARRYICSEDIAALEKAIDRCMSAVPPVKSFILPGTSEAGSRLHLARTLARRAERRLVELAEQVAVRQVLMQYINRLSDCLYALARAEDHHAQLACITRRVMERYLAAVNQAPQATPGASDAPLNFHDTHTLMKHAMQAALELQVPVVISVVDDRGLPVMTYRMPDTLLVSNSLAPKKAWTAVAMKAPTHTLSDIVQPGQALAGLEAMMNGDVVTFGGGYPLWRHGRIIGGLGISGGSVEQDMHIAQAAIEAAHLRKG